MSFNTLPHTICYILYVIYNFLYVTLVRFIIKDMNLKLTNHSRLVTNDDKNGDDKKKVDSSKTPENSIIKRGTEISSDTAGLKTST